jgi:hypothetical protein
MRKQSIGVGSSRVNDKCSLRICFIHAHGMVYIIEQCGNWVDLVPIVNKMKSDDFLVVHTMHI